MTNCFIVFCLYSVLLLMRILFSLSSISLPLNVEAAVMYIYMCFVKTADDVKCIIVLFRNNILLLIQTFDAFRMPLLFFDSVFFMKNAQNTWFLLNV